MQMKLFNARGDALTAEVEDRGLVGDNYETVFRVDGTEIVSRVHRDIIPAERADAAVFRVSEDVAVLEAHGYAIVP